MTAADEKRQKILDTPARARAIRAEQLAANKGRMPTVDALEQAKRGLTRIVKALQRAQCFETADRLRGEHAAEAVLARLGVALGPQKLDRYLARVGAIAVVGQASSACGSE
jgi:hypothetical protein